MMSRIINQKRYDTRTATCVAEYRNGPDFRSFFFVCERLYRKRTGEYFLHGSGEALSEYAQHYSDHSFSGGEAIIPLTEDEARQWCEQHCNADEVEEIFGAVSE